MYHFELWFSLGVCLGVELDHGVGHIVFLFVVFKGAPTLFSAVVVPSYIPSNGGGGVPFLDTLPSICFLMMVKNSTPGFLIQWF